MHTSGISTPTSVAGLKTSALPLVSIGELPLVLGHVAKDLPVYRSPWLDLESINS